MARERVGLVLVMILRVIHFGKNPRNGDDTPPMLRKILRNEIFTRFLLSEDLPSMKSIEGFKDEDWFLGDKYVNKEVV